MKEVMILEILCILLRTYKVDRYRKVQLTEYMQARVYELLMQVAKVFWYLSSPGKVEGGRLY